MEEKKLFTRLDDPTRKYFSIGYEDLKSLTDDSKKVIGNRMIDERHIKLFTGYSEQQLRNMPALTVNERTGRLIDGQHRVRAIVRMIEQGKLPKDYKYDLMFSDIAEEDERAEVINANINSKGWTQFNFIECYMKDADDDIAQNYIMLDKWCREHQLTAPKRKKSSPKFRYGAAMMKGVSCTSILKNGEFKVTKEELYEAHIIHNELIEILKAMDRPTSGAWLEYMATAWYNERRDTDFSKFMKTLKKEPTLSRAKGKPSNSRRDWEDIFTCIKKDMR